MSDYEFAGCLYRTRSDLVAAIASEWLCNAADADLRDLDVDADAAECIEAWELDKAIETSWGEVCPSFTERARFDAEDLAKAMREYIEDRLEEVEE